MGQDIQRYTFLFCAIVRGEVSASRSGRYTLGKRGAHDNWIDIVCVCVCVFAALLAWIIWCKEKSLASAYY